MRALAFPLLCVVQTVTALQWTPWASGSGELATDSYYSRVEGELFVPLRQRFDDQMVFAYLRGAKYGKRQLTDVSGGVGLRQVVDRTIVGLNLSYDGLLSRNGNWFNYIDVGGELFTSCLDFHLNGRIALGRRAHCFGAAPFAIMTFLDDDEVRLLTRLRSVERSAWSLDSELGLRVRRWGWTSRIYAGGQYVQRSDTETEANGAYFGLEFYNGELHSTPGECQITAGARFFTNLSRIHEGVFYVSFRKAFGSGCFDCCAHKGMLLSRMNDPIQRRLPPGVLSLRGGLLNEALTTVQYPVDGIWVSYEADGDTLQMQIDKAESNGGSNSMVFADGDYTENVTLGERQVLAGGNAFLDSKGKISGAPVPWGAWGNFTSNAAVVTASVAGSPVLTMEMGSHLDRATLVGGSSGIFGAGATDLTIRNAMVIATGDSLSFGVTLSGADNSLVENVDVRGAGFTRGGFFLDGTMGAQLSNIRSSQVGTLGNVIENSTGTLVNGLEVFEAAGISWVVDMSDETRIQNFKVTATGMIGISVVDSNDTTLTDGVITGETTDAISYATYTGLNSIREVAIDGYDSAGIRVGTPGVGSGNMAIADVQITSNDSANVSAGILIENSAAAGVETVSVDRAEIMGAGIAGMNRGFEINETAGTINLAGDDNDVFNVAVDCVVTGTPDGHILYNGGLKCPP